MEGSDGVDIDVSSSECCKIVCILGGLELVAVGGNVVVGNDLLWNDFWIWAYGREMHLIESVLVILVIIVMQVRVSMSRMDMNVSIGGDVLCCLALVVALN